MLWLAMSIVTLFVGQPVTFDSVDIAEINHVLSPVDGTESGKYWVWWRWQTVNGYADYYVADWRTFQEVPRPVNGVQEFWDSKNKLRRQIKSRIFVERFDFYDRESFDRQRLPENKRTKLRAK